MRKTDGGAVSGGEIAAFRRGLLAWFGANRRDLPWRRTTDPWRILVSEVMLQQTQVDRVKERYAAFFRRWKGIHEFAEAPFGDVLAFWVGLGYNRRAKNLHAAANVISRDHDGRVPRTMDALLALPGLGPYTAAAVLAFSWNENVVVCDTNVRRVVLRQFFGGEFADAHPSTRELVALFGALMPEGRSREWHSALMDFGSAVCTSRALECGTCPFRRTCRAFALRRTGGDAVRRLVRPQPRFEGSRRQARGAVIRMLARAGVRGADMRDFEAAIPSVDVAAVLSDLVDEGLVEEVGSGYRLPR